MIYHGNGIKTRNTKTINTKGSKTKDILKYLATGGLITLASLTNPKFPHYLIQAYFKNKKFHRPIFLRDLKRLQKRELINFEELANGETKIVLKKNGEKVALQYEIDNLKITKPKRWDGKWRLIIFDIPDKKRQASNALGGKLKQLGFCKLQKSVYIHPFPCEKEIEFIASLFEIRDHILIISVADFEDSEMLRPNFGL